jgi:hypothetical protein
MPLLRPCRISGAQEENANAYSFAKTAEVVRPGKDGNADPRAFWGSVQFGAEMGTGMRTYSPTGLPHVVAISLFLLESWSDALMAGAGFALGRALMLVVFLVARDKMKADKAFDFALPTLTWLFALLFLPLAALLVVR